MTVVLLIPCLMIEANRSRNLLCMNKAIDLYPVDHIVCYDQEFLSTDYLEGIEYIGHQEHRSGFVNSRNALLDYFYASDYDYAIWMDANMMISKTTLNDFITVIKSIQSAKSFNDQIWKYIDIISSTLGLQISTERMDCKKCDDYFSNVHLMKKDSPGPYTMHFFFQVNLKKKYNEVIKINPKCNPYVGLPEDVYFVKLLAKKYNSYLCPTIVGDTPSNKTSTWVSDKSGFKYPPKNKVELASLIDNDVTQYGCIHRFPYREQLYVLPRVDDFKFNLRPYKAKKSKITTTSEVKKVTSLW